MNKDMLIKCDECEYEFFLNAMNIENAEVKINDQQLTLIYFTCPKCNKIYRVSLCDTQYFVLKEGIEKTKKRIRRNHTDKLNEKFPGTFTFMVSENNQQEKSIKYLP